MGVLTHLQFFWGGAPPPYNLGRQKTKNLVRFRTTFNFECRDLWNGWSYRQAVNCVINYCLFWVKQKNDELWLTNYKVVFAHFNLPKIDSGRIFGQRSTLSTNISEMNQDTDTQLTAFSTVIHSVLNKINLANFGSLAMKFCLLISTSLKSTTHKFFDKFGLWSWISPEGIKILTSSKWRYHRQPIPGLTQKRICWTLVY